MRASCCATADVVKRALARKPCGRDPSRRHGKQVYVTTCESRKEAQAAEEDFRVTQRKIERGELAPAHDTKRTLRQSVEERLKSLENRKSRSHKGYSERMHM